MKKLKQLICRYPLSNVSVLVLFMIAYFAFYIGADLQKNIVNLNSDLKSYQYIAEKSFLLSGSQKLNLLKTLESNEGNISIENVTAFRNFDKSTCLINIIIQQNENLKYPLISGKYTDNKKDNIILLGQKLKDFTYTRDNLDYLELDGEEYRVIGYIGSQYSDLMDYSMIVYYERIGTELENRISTSITKTGIEILIQSDKSNIEEIFTHFVEKSNIEEYMISEEIGSMNIINTTNLATNRNYMVLICWFCLVNAIIVSEVWIYQRKQEISIRYTFGWNKIRIFIQLYKELICISMIATLIVLTGQIFLSFAFAKVFLFDFMDVFWHLIIMLFFALIASFITLIYPLWIIMKMIPVLALQKEREN